MRVGHQARLKLTDANASESDEQQSLRPASIRLMIRGFPARYLHLAIAHGNGWIQFGGLKGRTLVLEAGDILIPPAGTGHQPEAPTWARLAGSVIGTPVTITAL